MQIEKLNIFKFTDSEPSPFPSVRKVKNKGFEKLKNLNLRYELERCNKTLYYSEKHLKIEDWGYKILHQTEEGYIGDSYSLELVEVEGSPNEFQWVLKSLYDFIGFKYIDGEWVEFEIPEDEY
ncbi:hypothetical protein ACRZ9O_10435 [Aquirufa sp. HETE-40SA]